MRSLPRSNGIRLLGVFALLAAATMGCNSAPPDTVGVVRIALTAVPADVSCIRVRAMGSRDVTQDFDVTPGTSSMLSMGGVSTGSVELSAFAFAAPCATAGDSSTANWISAPVTVQVTTDAIADVTLVMHRNGRVNVGIDFQDDCNRDGGVPDGGKCLPPPSCHDKMRNATETDMDCGGGACPACKDGLRCLAGSDCQSGSCVSGRCAAATCIDQVKNGAETDVDCGGGACETCFAGGSCNVSSDCQSTVCVNSVCESTCTDGAKDGAETDQDCGGGTCGPCRDGGHCLANSDCMSLNCSKGRCGPTCMDQIQNGTETDVDCGGLCGPCGDGQHCQSVTDCASPLCLNGVCSASTCGDGITDGTETDADCGGGICIPCSGGGQCLVSSDCLSGSCLYFVCQASCSDGAKDGTETDQDCGGPTCGPCRDGGHCLANSDCMSLNCSKGRCGPTCLDQIQNGTETDVDCGGLCGPCAEGLHCLAATDCGSGSCVAGVCSAQTCAVPNGIVSWWHGDDSFTDSVGSNHGAPVGTVTFAPGVVHDGFSFDGSFQSFVEVADADDLDLVSGLTIDAWINPSEPSSARIVDKIRAFQNDGYLLDLVGSRLRIITGFDGLVTNDTVPAGVFTHVAGVFDGGGLALYINGVLAASGPAYRSAIPANDLTLKIGADSGGGSMFKGVIDEPRVWNRALSANEIQLLFMQPSSCP